MARGKTKYLRIIPLGGLEQIGMNMTVIEYGDTMIVVDCGISFPEDDMLGVDLVIPDFSYVIEHREKLKAVFITHAHEDHIGALPYFYKEFNVPLYATRLTMGIIEHKLEEHSLLRSVERHVVSFGDKIDAGVMQVEFVKTNHSIVDAAAFAIHTPRGIVFHTGDFKVDYTPVYGDPIDLQHFAEIGKRGVLALLCDSTNAEKPGFTPSESTLGETFDAIFQENIDKRLIIATFASNVDRVQQIINTAYAYGRKVALQGRSMENIIKTAIELGCIKMPPDTFIDIDDLKNYPDEKTVLITTGSQGESLSALTRMAGGVNKKVNIGPTDVVVFSSSPIPGNEKAVSKIINELFKKGANVVFRDVHVSGHACQEEIKLIYSLLKPKYAVPVHGEYKHLKAQEKIAMDLGYDSDHIFILQSGDALEFDAFSAKVGEHVQTGAIMVDGLGVGDVGNVVLRDRQKLAEDGMIIVVMTLETGSGRLLSGPDMVSRGFVYVKDSEDLMVSAQNVVRETVEMLERNQVCDWNIIKNEIRDVLGGFVWNTTKRRPMILPIIMEVDL